jgi:alginate O-acetyltransferase complex protein AlgI
VGFKYLTLVISTVSELFGHASLWNISIALPLGISFFTFEFIHYIADIYRGKIGNHNFLTFLSFTFFFPTLVSGPIKRFETFESSLQEKQFLPAMFWTGCITILLGYSQKYLIADMLVPFTTALSAPQTIPTQTFAIAGIVCYAIRIYADFLGMSNIAIGSALLFGITVPKNFHAPYLSSDIALFWRRWHMSLSSWVRDYLYIPLGGNRVGRMREYANVFIVMTIVGLWHGASWNFAIWGLWHGIGLAFHRLWRDLRPEHAIFETRFAKLCGCFLTCAFVTIGWTFFVTTSLEDSFHLLSIIFFGTHV